MVEHRAKSNRPLGCSPGSRRMRSSEKPLMPEAGTNWHMAAAAPSGPRTTARSRPVSRGSKTRPNIIENPRSCSPCRLRLISPASSADSAGSRRDGSWNEAV